VGDLLTLFPVVGLVAKVERGFKVVWGTVIELGARLMEVMFAWQ